MHKSNENVIAMLEQQKPVLTGFKTCLNLFQ